MILKRKRSVCASGSDDEEVLRQKPRRAVDRHLVFLHRLEQRRLRLRWRAVDFIRQQDVAENRSGQKFEGLRVGLENVRADQVGRHQVGRELDAPETHVQGRRQRAREERLGQARHALQDHVTAGQQRDERFLDQRFLADDDLADFLPDLCGAK